MKRLNIIAFICCLFFINVTAQSPYELKLKKELSIVGTGLGLGGAAYYLHKKMPLLSEMQISRFEEEGISSFEEWATKQGSEKSDRASDILLISSQILPGILTLADQSMRKDFLKIGTLYSEVFLVNLGMTAFAKNAVRRTRPFVYDSDVTLEEKLVKSARTSFYSGHTSETAAMCFLTAHLYADYHPSSKWKPAVWTAAAAIPAVTGYLRMRAGKHFPSDVITGYVMGAAVGYFLPRLHWVKKKKNEKEILDEIQKR